MAVTKQLEYGTIEILLEGIPQVEVERFRAIIHELFAQGFFYTKNGKAVVHFDHEGNMRQLDYDYTKWRSGKPSLQQDYSVAKIQTTTQTSQPRHQAVAEYL